MTDIDKAWAKIVLNSELRLMWPNETRLYDPDLSAAITETAQAALLALRETVGNYPDTESVVGPYAG